MSGTPVGGIGHVDRDHHGLGVDCDCGGPTGGRMFGKVNELALALHAFADDPPSTAHVESFRGPAHL